jgi:hypothetical protein
VTTSAINPISPEVSFTLPGDRLLEATRAWLVWLQGLFKSRPIGQYKWHPNLTETEIIISDQNPSGMETTNKRPLIVTSRGPAGWVSSSTSQRTRLYFHKEDEVISDIINCSVTISIIAREGLEAQNIAYTIFRMVPVFKAEIMRVGRMHAIGNNIQLTPETQHGQVVPGSSTPEWKMVQLIIPFYVQDVISVTSEDFYTLIKAVKLHMGLRTH